MSQQINKNCVMKWSICGQKSDGELRVGQIRLDFHGKKRHTVVGKEYDSDIFTIGAGDNPHGRSG